MAQNLFSVSEDVFDRFPGYQVGYVIAEVNSNQEPYLKANELLRDAEDRARILYADKDLKDEPAIAVWRKAFSESGWSASKFPPSVEALVKRAARGHMLPNINPAVDLGNAAALTYLVPAGCHDLDLSPDLTVRISAAGDRFLPMGDAGEERPDEGEIVYATGHNVRTRRWVWRQSREGLVTTSTTRIFYPVDGFEGVTSARVETATRFLAATLVEHFGASVKSGLVTRDHPTVSHQ